MDLTSAPVPPLRDDDHVLGLAGAPLVALYADFTCPRCAMWWGRLRPLVDAGDVRVLFRHLALRSKHPRAVALANAAEAAGLQEAFFAFADRVYADHGRIDDPHLWAHCQALGLDVVRFEEDRRGPAATLRVARDVREALRAGAVATPTAFALDPEATARLGQIGLEAVTTGPGTDGPAA